MKRIDDTVNSERSADHGQPHHVHAICNHEIASRPRDKLGLTRYDSNNRIEDSCVLRLYVLTPSLGLLAAVIFGPSAILPGKTGKSVAAD